MGDGLVYDGEANWWHQARQVDPEAAELCDELAAWLGEVPKPRLRHDFVHLDLNFSNLLAVGDDITGIIDVDHMGTGDRSVDIASLAFQFHNQAFLAGVEPCEDIVTHLGNAASSISGESGWRQAVTYLSVSALGWSSPEGFRAPLAQAKYSVRRMMKLQATS